MKSPNFYFSAFTFFLITSCSTNGGKISVPDAVKKAFQTAHSDKKAEWEKEDDSYEAEYKENGIEKSIVYDAQGNVIETEAEIPVAELPAGVADYVNKNHNGYTIEEAERMESSKGTFYEVEIKGKGQELELVFDSNGNFVEQETEDEPDDSEKDD